MVNEVPGYVLREPIGTGSSATVWRGEALGTPGRVVAIKVVPHGNGRAATDALRREGEILGRLSHPSILQVVAVVPTVGGLALVAPYAPGGSLAAMLAHAPGGLPAGVVADIGARLASALAAMHGAGILHRDLKPANVLFDREGQPLLGDVGLARCNGDATTIAGTAEYLDPELLDGREPDARSDLYALGITLYEALSGVPPYAGASTAQTVAAAERGRFVPLAAHVRAPAELTSLIEAAFARDVRHRPAGAHELAGRLDEIRRSLEEVAEGPPPHPPSTGGRAGVLGALPALAGPEVRTDPGPVPPPTSLGGTSRARAADGGRSATVAWGPPAPSPVPRHEPTRRRVPRAVLVAAAIAVVLVPVVVVVVSVVGDRAAATGDPVAAPTIDSGDAEHVDGDQVRSEVPRESAPVCEGMQAPIDGRATLRADVADRGCSTLVAWDGRRLEVLADDGTSQRYDLGARPGDVLLFGDWTCDGRDAPALYRPGDGRLFTFAEMAGAGEPISVTGTPTGVTGGSPTVLTDGEGCDRVEVVS